MQQDMLVSITSEGITNTRLYGTNYPTGVITNLPNGNKLGIMQLNRQLDIFTQIDIGLPQPWTFLFSAKPNLSSGINRSYLVFGNNSSLFLEWSSGTFMKCLIK